MDVLISVFVGKIELVLFGENDAFVTFKFNNIRFNTYLFAYVI